MFEHLDDPRPHALPTGLRAAVLERVRRRRRRRLAVAGGVASIAALGAGSLAAVRDRLEPERIDVAGLAGEPSAVLGTDPAEPGDPVTVLVVGIDGAWPPGLQPDGSERDWPGYTDTIALVRLDPEDGEVRLLTVPRDLVVRTEDGEMRINETFATGGPSGLIRVLGETLGMPVDHFVQVDFGGARDLVDAIGGIRVAVDRPVRDDQTGLVMGAGCQTLDGFATLALGRARHVAVQQDDGSWAYDPASGAGREARGAVVAAALLQAAGRIGVDDLPELVRTGLDSVTVDDGLDREDLERWAREARDDRFVPLGLPVADDVLRGGDVLRLVPDAAGAALDAFDGGGSDPIPAVADGVPVVEGTGLRPC